jgi:hypothetical protein
MRQTASEFSDFEGLSEDKSSFVLDLIDLEGNALCTLVIGPQSNELASRCSKERSDFA